MARNGSGVRDTARVLSIRPVTVINELKKESELHVVNHNFLATHAPERIVVDIIKVQDDHDVSEQGITVEMDEMWSYVGSKANQRWLWHAIDRATGEVLAYVLGKRRDEVFLELKGLFRGDIGLPVNRCH